MPSAALVWLGWRLIEQDRQLERERMREALDVAASEITAALERGLSATDRRLPALAGTCQELARALPGPAPTGRHLRAVSGPAGLRPAARSDIGQAIAG